MRRAALLLGFLVASAAAKPITLRVDRVIANAEIIAEVEFLAVQRAHRLGTGGIRVRVTGDPRRIFRGARFSGAELDLIPFPSGRRVCTMELSLYWRLGKRALLVIDAQHVVHLVGDRLDAGYRVRGWCDFNSCWLRCEDRGLGESVRRDKFRVSTRGLRARYGDEEAGFWAKVAPHLCGATRPLAPAELQRLLAGLGSGERRRRELAHRRLLERGRHPIAALRAAAERTDDPEQRRRIRAVLEAHADDARAAEIARGLTDVEARAWVVRAALPHLEGPERDDARKYLLQPDPDAQRHADDDEHDD